MTLTSIAMSLSPKFWFVTTTGAILLLGFAHNTHLTNAVEAPPPTKDMISETYGHDGEVFTSGALGHIYYWLECPAYHQSEQALEIHNETTWNLLKTTYQGIVHEDINTLPPPSKHESLKGYQVPIEVKKIPGIEPAELGVFTKNPIPKGTLVWKSTFTAQFTKGSDFRSFLKVLPDKLACDIIDWSFPRYKEEEPVLCVDLDHGSLTNQCDVKEECNLELKGEKTGCELEFYATRDIAADEELLIDHDFHQDHEALVPLGLAHHFQPHLEDYEEEDYEEDGEGDEEGEDDEGDEDEEEEEL